MAESSTTILPAEVMIEILYRVELNNTLQLRCVCKLWKSLVHDPQFVKNHLFKLLNDITVLFSKTAEQFNAFKSQNLINNPVVPQEQEQVVDEHGEEEAAQEDNNAAAEEGDAADEEEEEENVVDAEEEDEKHWLMTALAKLDGVLVNVQSLKGDFKFINLDTEIQAVEDRMKCLRSFMRIYLKSETFSSS